MNQGSANNTSPNNLSNAMAPWKYFMGFAILFLVLVLGFLKVKNSMTKVQKVAIKRGNLQQAIYGSGQLTTEKSFDLKLGIAAKIISLKKSLGDRVQKGEELVVFDNHPSFKSPIDGIITALNYKNGESVFAQAVILSIVDSEDFYLAMSLDQKSIRYVKEKQVARISFDGYRDLKLEGVVRSTFSNKGMFYAIIDFKNQESSFLKGMSADIAIMTELHENVLLAPKESLKNGKILVQRESGVQEIPVEVGISEGSLVEVKSPQLHEGDLSIINL
jgi:multidrug efflux pump subunit AcrA (membrane-fusion protein)